MTESQENLSDRIVKCCLDQYERFQKRFRPQENQWTILAGIVMEYTDNSEQKEPLKKTTELKCVSLGTGMKCIGKSHRLPTGEIINDSHAEVLSRRAFQKYIYSEIQACIENKKSILTYNKETRKFSVDKHLRFHLYVSQAPCGDASTVSLSELQTEEERIINENKKRIFNEKQQQSIKQTKLENENILRGRLNYDKLGILRTKPGRIDADPTLSMSCSDKILKWTYLGMAGSLLMHFLEQPIYLSSVTVEDMYDEASLHRALISRGDDVKELPKPFVRTKPNIWQSSHYLFPYTKKQIEAKGKDHQEALQTNEKKKRKKNKIKADDKAIYWETTMNQPEVIINGRKQGASPKNGIYNKKTWSDLCKYKMFELFGQTYSLVLKYQQQQQQQSSSPKEPTSLSESNLNKNTLLKGKSYQDFKNESMAYMKAKNYLFYGIPNNRNDHELTSTTDKKKAVLEGWTQKPTGFQDFKLSFE